MGWQIAAVILAVLCAAAYLSWRAWRTLRRSKDGCGGSCGCSGQSQAPTPVRIIASEELLQRLHRRQA